MPHIQTFTTEIKVFDWQGVLFRFIVPFWGSWALGFQTVKGQIVAVCSCSTQILAVQRSPGSAPKIGFDRLIQFWSRSQMFLHGTYEWLSLVSLRFQLDRIPHCLWVTMTKCSLLPRFSVYHLIYCKPISGAWNELGYKIMPCLTQGM